MPEITFSISILATEAIGPLLCTFLAYHRAGVVRLFSPGKMHVEASMAAMAKTQWIDIHVQ